MSSYPLLINILSLISTLILLKMFQSFNCLSVLQSADVVVLNVVVFWVVVGQVSVLHPGHSAAQNPQKPSFNLP